MPDAADSLQPLRSAASAAARAGHWTAARDNVGRLVQLVMGRHALQKGGGQREAFLAGLRAVAEEQDRLGVALGAGGGDPSGQGPDPRPAPPMPLAGRSPTKRTR